MATVADQPDPVSHISFSTSEAQFTWGILPNDELWTPARVIIAKLASTKWGLVVSQDDSTPASQPYAVLIDNLFWFEASEIRGTITIILLSTFPNAFSHRTQYTLRLLQPLIFARCLHAITEAKVNALHERTRLLHSLHLVFQEQLANGPTTEDTPPSTQTTTVSPPGYMEAVTYSDGALPYAPTAIGPAPPSPITASHTLGDGEAASQPG